MQKALFLAIQAHIVEQNIGIEHIDWFNNQYAESDPGNRQEGDFAYPAVFIEFQPFQTQSLASGKVQKADVTFRLHLVTTNYAHSRYGVPEQDEALEHLDKASQLYVAFQRWSQKDEQGRQVLNTCHRTNVIPDHNQTNQVVNIQDFRTVAFDFAAVPVRQTVGPSLSLQQ